jgi:hypothetical protein
MEVVTFCPVREALAGASSVVMEVVTICPVREALVWASSVSSTFSIAANARESKTKHRIAMAGKKHDRKYFLIRIFIFPVRTKHFSAEVALSRPASLS